MNDPEMKWGFEETLLAVCSSLWVLIAIIQATR